MPAYMQYGEVCSSPSDLATVVLLVKVENGPIHRPYMDAHIVTTWTQRPGGLAVEAVCVLLEWPCAGAEG
jgi:hypothetical protein